MYYIIKELMWRLNLKQYCAKHAAVGVFGYMYLTRYEITNYVEKLDRASMDCLYPVMYSQGHLGQRLQYSPN